MKSWGCDPELMLKKGNKYVSAIDVVPANAEDRLTIEGHQFYYDNVLAEFAMKPAESKTEALKNLKRCLELYAEIVAPNKLTAQAYQKYPDNIWKKLDPITKEPIAAVAGCAVDNCAYNVRSMEPPKESIQSNTERSAGGHVHLGDERLLDGENYGLWVAPSVVMMDLLIGIPFLFLDLDETGPNRRSIYGQAGRFRICDYGLEYRTPSNFWLRSPELAGLMYDLCEFTCNFITEGQIKEFCEADSGKYCSSNPEKAYDYKGFDCKKLYETINNSDTGKEGSKLLELSLNLLPKDIVKEIERIRSSKQNYENLYQEWDL